MFLGVDVNLIATPKRPLHAAARLCNATQLYGYASDSSLPQDQANVLCTVITCTNAR
jgi:hypothetical protein